MSHNTESITGLLDGELKGMRLWAAKRHISACPLCALEYRRQQQVRRLLQANPSTVVMTDSPDFFWSKVKKEIERRGEESVEVPLPRLTWADRLQQYQSAIAVVAALVIAAGGMIWFIQTARRRPSVTASVTAPAGFAQAEQVKTPVPHSAATTFDSDDDDVTVIWVTGLPWSPDMDGMKTQYANLDT